jgi:hypothetical protein
MKAGIPREIKNHEYRALTPAGVQELVRGGHEVYVVEGAGTAPASWRRTSSRPGPRSSRMQLATCAWVKAGTRSASSATPDLFNTARAFHRGWSNSPAWRA